MIRPGESLDDWRQRMMDKAAKARGFVEREQAALQSQVIAKKGRPAPKPARRAIKATSELDLTRAIGITRQNERPKPVPAPAPATPRGQRRMGAPRTRPDYCLGCQVTVYRASSSEPRPEGARRLVARGLCTTCYPRAKKAGVLT